MDFSPFDQSDPFRTLDPDLDEVLNGLTDPNLNSTSRNNQQMESMDTSMGPSSSHHYSASTPPSAYMHQSVVAHSSQYNSSPQYPMDTSQLYFQSQLKQEVSVQPPLFYSQCIAPVLDPYSLKFSPPTFSDGMLSPTARMLPQLRPSEDTTTPPSFYPPPNSQKKDTEMATLLTPLERKLMERPGIDIRQKELIIKKEDDEPKATKDQLLKLLISLTPSEVERLKEGVEQVIPEKEKISSRIRPSGVATRVTKEVSPFISPIPSSSRKEIVSMESDYEEDDEEEDETRSINRRSSNERIPHKPERRTAHNLIEKKYRCSINDRIQMLKQMMSGGAKMSKSATLRRAIEYIEELEGKNRELNGQVTTLTRLCSDNGIETSFVFTKRQLSPTGSTSPLSLTTSPSTQTSPVSSHSSAPRHKRSRMMDQGRISLCVIMFALLVWNPLSSLTSPSSPSSPSSSPSSSSNSHFTARTLQSMAFDPSYSRENDWHESVGRTCFVWFVNIVIVFCVLTRLLVYGEPVHDFKSRTWAAFLATRKQAINALEGENRKEAHRQLVECLQILDRPLPYTQLDEGMAVTWQVMRHLLNGLWIGRWFARRRRDERKPMTVVCKSHAHTAIIYHQLNQLDLFGLHSHLPPPTALRGLYLALSSVNLAESAGASTDGLPHSTLAHIFMAAAIRCRLSLPSFISPVLHSYFLRRSRRHVRRSPVSSVASLHFLFHPIARKFCSDPIRLRLSLEDCPSPSSSGLFCTPATGLAIDRIRAAFKVHLMNVLLSSLRVPNPAGSVFYSALDIVDSSQLLLSLCTSSSSSSSSSTPLDESSIPGDPICTWWAHLLTCGLLWRADKGEQAKSHYTIVRRIPPELLNNPLALAVGHAFCARKLRIDDANWSKFSGLVKGHVGKALNALRITPPMGCNNESIMRLQEGMRLLTLEWSMSSLLAAWRSQLDPSLPYWTQTLPVEYRLLYQEAITMETASLGKIGKERSEELAKCQQWAFQLTARMLNGANAVDSYEELLRLQRTVNERYAKLPSIRDDTPLSYHLHVLTKLHIHLTTVPSK